MTDDRYPLTVGGEEVPGEQALLARVEDGELMSGPDSVRYLVLHCSATRCTQDYTAEQLLHDHRARGFRTVGYQNSFCTTIVPVVSAPWAIISTSAATAA